MKTGLPRHLMITCFEMGQMQCRIAKGEEPETMAREYGTYVLALGDSTETNLNLSLGEDIGGGGHVNQEV